MVKFSNEKPAVFERLQRAFGVKWGGELVIAYNGTIHHTQPLHPSVIVHESVHIERQGNSADGWYSRYIADSKFRFGEELLAYRAQYKYLSQTVKDRNELFRFTLKLAGDLSGSMYGNVIPKSDAMKLIKLQQ